MLYFIPHRSFAGLQSSGLTASRNNTKDTEYIATGHRQKSGNTESSASAIQVNKEILTTLPEEDPEGSLRESTWISLDRLNRAGIDRSRLDYPLFRRHNDVQNMKGMEGEEPVIGQEFKYK
ncbi:hypothetical protein Taro_031232 [Colocasia esculenta]|uniref:Uncharacterized protein n=1 Tax=Colocasia esculenta TaxID=4460 RepID=A0A843VYG3_COLES|nr:hypothetical protein [Colocasia esculenta]